MPPEDGIVSDPKHREFLAHIGSPAAYMSIFKRLAVPCVVASVMATFHVQPGAAQRAVPPGRREPVASQASDPAGFHTPDLSQFRMNRARMPGACLQASVMVGFAVDNGDVLTRRNDVTAFVQSLAAKVAEVFADCTPVRGRATGPSTITAFAVWNGVTLRSYTATAANNWTPDAGVSMAAAAPDAVSASPPQLMAASGPLADRGIAGATLLADDGRRATYLTPLKDGPRALVVMMHTVRPDEPLLSFSLDSPMTLGLTLAASEVDYFNSAVANRLGAEPPSRVTVVHYAKDTHLPYVQPVADGQIELPLLTTAFVTGLGTGYRVVPGQLVAKGSRATQEPDQMLRNSVADIHEQFAANETARIILGRNLQSFAGAQSPSTVAATRAPAVASAPASPAAAAAPGGRGAARPPATLAAGTPPAATTSRVNASNAAAYTAKRAQDRKEALEAGYIFKNDKFWFSGPGDDLRNVFDGELPPQNDGGGLLLRLTLDAYVNQKNNRCQPDQDAAMFTVTTTTTTPSFLGWRYAITNTTTSQQSYFVDRRFAEIYAEYFDARGKERIGQDLVTRIDARQLNRLRTFALDEGWRRLRLFTSVTQQMKWLFEQAGCSSPLIAQLTENMYRYATGMPTVQASRFAIANAIAENDAALEIGNPQNLREACVESFPSPYQSFRPMQFCRCVDENLEPRLSRQEYRRYTRDYALLEEMTRTMPSGGRDYQIYQGVASCRQ